MTALIVTQSGRLYVEAALEDFHAAGLFRAFRGAATPVRMGVTNRADAERLADFINRRKRERDAAALTGSRA